MIVGRDDGMIVCNDDCITILQESHFNLLLGLLLYCSVVASYYYSVVVPY